MQQQITNTSDLLPFHEAPLGGKTREGSLKSLCLSMSDENLPIHRATLVLYQVSLKVSIFWV